MLLHRFDMIVARLFDPTIKAGNSSSLSCALLCLALMLLLACNRTKQAAQVDNPRLTANATVRDVTFHSAALNRDMQYRVITPLNIANGQRLAVVYLLHGGGGGFRDWSNYSDVARFAENGLILVMPEGGSSYYTNSAERPDDRYEDYVINDLVDDVDHRFPTAAGRADRAIVGVSMGGFGAVKLALKHPQMFVFAGGISSAIDVPRRAFSIRRMGQWRSHKAIFGPWGSETRRQNDPFALAHSADPAKAPYIFLSCGDQEGLLPANREFAALLARRRFAYEFHVASGGHNWMQWNAGLATLFQSLSARMDAQSSSRRVGSTSKPILNLQKSR